MELQGRNLSIRTQGEDVKLLQQELRKLGFSIEDKAGYFGKSTRDAVLDFQQKNGLKPTGVVDQKTAALLTRELAKQLQKPKAVTTEKDPKKEDPKKEEPKAEDKDDDDDDDKDKTIRISGHVLKRRTGNGAPGLRVEAWHKDGMIGSAAALTDSAGAFQIDLEESDFEDSHDDVAKSHDDDDHDDEKPKKIFHGIYFRILRGTQAIPIKKHSLEWKKTPGGAEVTIRVDIPGEFIVSGQVRNAGGSVFAGAKVRASDKDLRTEEALGETTTDPEGRYEIEYTAEQFSRAEKKAADLIVRAFDRANTELVSSGVIFNAQPNETVDLLVGGGRYLGPSEYEQLIAELTPILEGLSPADLREDTDFQDVTFLEKETGIERERIDFLRLAALHAADTEVPAEAFYGLFRQKLPTELRELLKTDQASYRKALGNALKDNLIPLGIKASLEDILARLEQLRLTRTLDDAPVEGATPVRDVLETTLVTPEIQKSFFDLYSNVEGSIQEFWETLRAHPQFGQEGLVDELQTTLRLGFLAQNHVPLVQHLQSALAGGTLARRSAAAGGRASLREVSELSDLATLDESDWLELIQSDEGGAPIGVPVLTPGENEADKAAHYAGTLAATVEAAFPTEVVASRTAESEVPGADALAVFFSDNPLFDIQTTRLDAYLAEHPDPDPFRGVPETDREATAARLNGMQRIYRLTASYKGMRALLDDGLDSARAIARVPMKNFTDQYAEALGGAVPAARVYQKARRSTATALALYGKFGAGINATGIAAIPTAPLPEGPAMPGAAGTRATVAATTTLPDWATLFGTQALSFCECQHCRSVCSPAAYLVDILNMLKSRAAADVLFGRRPDIEEIELSCQNTNTTLPYVDLVNELLESAVSPAPAPPPGMPTAARQRQTTKPTAELLAYPEHLNPRAYDLLKQATYPWDLPFHLWWEEVRGYFEHLGIKREALMTTFQVQTSDSEGGVTLLPSGIDIATERLGLTPFERAVITTADTDTADWGVGNLDSEDFSNVATLLRRSGLSFAQLETLLATEFIKAELDDESYVIGPDPAHPEHADTCDTAQLFVQPAPTMATLDRFHRFVRLWRKLGWTMQEVDRAIAKVGESALSVEFLISLSQLKQLMTELKLPVGKMLDFWPVLNPVPGRNAQLAKALGIALDDLQALIVLTAGADPFSGPAAMAQFVERVRKIQRSRFSVAQLKYLYLHAAAAGDPVAPLQEDVIRLLRDLQDGLGRIAAETAMPPVPTRELLEKKLALLYDAQKIENALAFLAGMPPNTPANQALVHLHFPFTDLAAAYAALLVPAPPPSGPAREAHIASAISFVLRSLLAHLRASASENLVKQTLSDALALDNAVTDLLLGSVLRSRSVAVLPAMIDYLSLLGNGVSATYYQNLTLTGSGTARVETNVDFTWGSGSPDPSIPIGDFSARFEGRLFAPERDGYTFSVSTSGGIRLWIWNAGQPIPNDPVIDAGTNASPADFLAAAPLRLSGPEQFYAVRLEFIKRSPDAFLHLSWSTSSVPEEVIPPRRFFTGSGLQSFRPVIDSFTVLRKAALLISSFKITGGELAYLAAHRADFNRLDLNALPVDPAGFAPEPSLFQQWERLLDVFALRDGLPRGDMHLFNVFAAASADTPDLDAVKALVAAVTGWNRANVDQLVAQLGLTVANFKNEIGLLRLRECIALGRRLGVPVAQLFAWGSSPPDRAQADNVRATLEAKYDERQWLEKARPLRDALRERQRAALVSYLVARPAQEESGPVWDDANGLYNHFLVDVEMSPCQLTSRIKLAISSAQLFIQRSLMNLEPEVALRPGDAKHWREWMKSYRVWEANRKVFLYPENWIQPELRDDKSPFFKELENELQQNEITNDSAETALLHYLEKLDGVARLQICGMYRQQEAGGDPVDILHVVGRTFGAPSLYYHRKRIDSAYWTPWEKIDVDIEGDHLIPMIFNRRLYLFWPVFAEKAPQDIPIPAPNTAGQKPATFFEIKLAWSEHRDGKWSAKRVSSEALTTAGLSRARDDYVFKGRVDNSGSLVFGCYTRRA